MVKAPFWIPDAPNPATARPIINIFEEEATPQTNEPNSNRAKKARKVHLRKSAAVKQGTRLFTLESKLAYSLPVSGRRVALLQDKSVGPESYSIQHMYLASWYALPYHPTS